MPDMSVENKVVVRIFGDEYPITGDNDPSYIAKIADLVDSRMRDVARVSKSQARDKVAILAAMSIASELHSKGEESQFSEKSVQSRVDSLISRLDEALSD
jgi:cell division protein ZapA